jgi:hypothetical protein
MLHTLGAAQLNYHIRYILSTFAGLYYYENEVTKKRQSQYHYPGLQQEHGGQ